MAFGKHCTHGQVTTRSSTIFNQAVTNWNTLSQLRESRLAKDVRDGEECWRGKKSLMSALHHGAKTVAIIVLVIASQAHGQQRAQDDNDEQQREESLAGVGESLRQRARLGREVGTRRRNEHESKARLC